VLQIIIVVVVVVVVLLQLLVLHPRPVFERIFIIARQRLIDIHSGTALPLPRRRRNGRPRRGHDIGVRARPPGRVLAQGPHQRRLVGAAVFSRHAQRFFQGRSLPAIASHRRVGVRLEQLHRHGDVGNAPVCGQV